MHLGVNLRDAHVKALSGSPPSVDSMVHSAWKLLGHLGTNPEYGRGVQAFPEYIKALLEEAEAVADRGKECWVNILFVTPSHKIHGGK